MYKTEEERDRIEPKRDRCKREKNEKKNVEDKERTD